MQWLDPLSWSTPPPKKLPNKNFLILTPPQNFSNEKLFCVRLKEPINWHTNLAHTHKKKRKEKKKKKKLIYVRCALNMVLLSFMLEKTTRVFNKLIRVLLNSLKAEIALSRRKIETSWKFYDFFIFWFFAESFYLS